MKFNETFGLLLNSQIKFIPIEALDLADEGFKLMGLAIEIGDKIYPGTLTPPYDRGEDGFLEEFNFTGISINLNLCYSKEARGFILNEEIRLPVYIPIKSK